MERLIYCIVKSYFTHLSKNAHVFVLVCLYMYSFARVVITNTTDWLASTTDIYFSFLEARSPWSRCQKIQFLVRALLACRQLPPHWGLTWPVLGACWKREYSLAFLHLIRHWSHQLRASPLRPHLTWIYFQRPYLQIPSHLGLRFQHKNLKGTQFSWKTVCNVCWATLLKII